MKTYFKKYIDKDLKLKNLNTIKGSAVINKNKITLTFNDLNKHDAMALLKTMNERVNYCGS